MGHVGMSYDIWAISKFKPIITNHSKKQSSPTITVAAVLTKTWAFI